MYITLGRITKVYFLFLHRHKYYINEPSRYLIGIKFDGKYFADGVRFIMLKYRNAVSQYGGRKWPQPLYIKRSLNVRITPEYRDRGVVGANHYVGCSIPSVHASYNRSAYIMRACVCVCVDLRSP